MMLLLWWMVASTAGADPQNRWQSLRDRMVDEQIAAAGISDQQVLEAMRFVPRHEFVPESQQPYAYDDTPLPIGEQQTISQPYIVALMSELLELDGSEKVLEIGTGSGYQAAVLSRLAKEVYTIEIRGSLGLQARKRLEALGFGNVHVRIGNGYQGWPEEAPFDAIIVTAAPEEVPEALLDQLKVGGKMVLPLGRGVQSLQVLTKNADGIAERDIVPVRFVPMIQREP